MPEWPYDYCPLLFSLEGRQREDSLEGEIARAVFGEDADEFRPDRHLDERGESLAGPVETNQAGNSTAAENIQVSTFKASNYHR